MLSEVAGISAASAAPVRLFVLNIHPRRLMR
jgi:hypothetical protein